MACWSAEFMGVNLFRGLSLDLFTRWMDLLQYILTVLRFNLAIL